MFAVTKIVSQKEVDYCIWQVVFQIDHSPLEYSTDFLYLVKEKKWVINSLITHELTSIMKGHSCLHCGEAKISCQVASKKFLYIKQAIIENEQFFKMVSSSTDNYIDPTEISTNILIINDKEKWDELVSENRFYGNLLRIQKLQS